MDDIILSGVFRSRILNGLVEEGLLLQEDLEAAIKSSRERMKPIQEALIEEGYISREKLIHFIEKHLELPRVDLSSYVPDPEALKLIPKSVVHKYMILPLFEIEGVLTAAVANPLTIFNLDEISEELNITIDPVIATEESIIDAIIIYYGVTPDEIDTLNRSKSDAKDIDYPDEELFRIDLDRLAIIEGEAVNELLGEIFTKAKKARASAIHIEPFMGDFRLMFRIDDELVIVGEAARSLQKPLLENLRQLARIPRSAESPIEKLAELPRAGEVLISIYPSIYGERCVINFTVEEKGYENLADFGFTDDELEKLSEILNVKPGLIIVGAPIRSGKTSFLRAALKEVSHRSRSCFLLGQDEVRPVQNVQFQKLKGEKLLSAISSISYQDIDIVGIDEIDASEAFKSVIRLSEKSLAIVAIEATNVVDAVRRFLDAGVEPFSLSWNLKAVISFRLFNKNCPSCAKPYKSPLMSHKAVKKYLGEDAVVMKSEGCAECVGRNEYVIVPEVLFMKESIAQRIAINFNEESFYNFIRSKAVETPLKRAFELVRNGMISLEEVYRKTGFRE
jgi:type IV pilus assembly protein PilB